MRGGALLIFASSAELDSFGRLWLTSFGLDDEEAAAAVVVVVCKVLKDAECT